MKRYKRCIIMAFLLFGMGIGYSFLPNDVITGGMLFGFNNVQEKMEMLDTIYKVIMILFSIFLCVDAIMYSRDYKKENGKSPNGYGLIILGSIMSILGLFFGTLFVGMGAVFALLNKKKLNS